MLTCLLISVPVHRRKLEGTNSEFLSLEGLSLVMMETGLMTGRVINVAPICILVSHADYAGHFVLLGAALLSLIPSYFVSTKTNGEAAG